MHFCTEYLVSNQFLSQHVGIAALPSLAWRSQLFAGLLALQIEGLGASEATGGVPNTTDELTACDLQNKEV